MRNLKSPISIWKSGSSVEVNAIALVVVYDNLKDSAAFRYDLLHVGELPPLEEGGEPRVQSTPVISETLYMDASEYEMWGIAPDINTAAYMWAAKKLNLELDL